MSGGVNSGSVYGMRGGRGFYSRGRGGRGESWFNDMLLFSLSGLHLPT